MNACITLSTAFFSIYKSNFDSIFRGWLFFFILNVFPSTVYSDEEDEDAEYTNKPNLRESGSDDEEDDPGASSEGSICSGI